jgi:hypothetical protein
LPMWPFEPRRLENPLSFFCRLGSPVQQLSAAIPLPSHQPALLYAHDSALLERSALAPAIHIVFRPEEEDGASREADVVPGVPRWDQEMDAPFPPCLTAEHAELNVLSAFCTAGPRGRIYAE